MKACASCKAEKLLCDFGKDRSRKDGLHPYCKTCSRQKQRIANEKWRAKNPTAGKEYMARRRSDPAIKAAERARAKELYHENPGRYIAKVIMYNEANREKRAAYMRRYKEKNRHIFNAHKAKYYVMLTQATPPWVDYGAIKSIYAEARKLSEETGIPHEVDHIIPLRNKKVSGLHVQQNLRVIPASENRRKSNRLILTEGIS